MPEKTVAYLVDEIGPHWNYSNRRPTFKRQDFQALRTFKWKYVPAISSRYREILLRWLAGQTLREAGVGMRLADAGDLSAERCRQCVLFVLRVINSTIRAAKSQRKTDRIRKAVRDPNAWAPNSFRDAIVGADLGLVEGVLCDPSGEIICGPVDFERDTQSVKFHCIRIPPSGSFQGFCCVWLFSKRDGDMPVFVQWIEEGVTEGRVMADPFEITLQIDFPFWRQL